MTGTVIDRMIAELRSGAVARRVGRVAAVSGGQLSVSGLSDCASPGDFVSISKPGRAAMGEVISTSKEQILVQLEEAADGLRIGQEVFHEGPLRLWPSDQWVGRIIDPFGRPLDGRTLPLGAEARSPHSDPPEMPARRGLGARLRTGLVLFDTLLPIVRGQRIGLFAGPGVGKSTLLARLATGLEADVVVFALVGERGRELREFTDRVLGPGGMARSVVVAAAADRPALVRRRAVETAMAVAEHFRDAGKHVLLLVDSLTRFAEAHREIALSAGETAALRGHPPSMPHRLMQLAERAGPGGPGQGDITALFSVLVAGSDMNEPVADTLRGVLDGHVILSRPIAERGRYPAVDVTASISRALPEAASGEENALIGQVRDRLSRYEQSELMIRSGLYAPGSDPDLDQAIAAWPRLDRILGATSPGTVQDSFAQLAGALQPISEEPVAAEAPTDAEPSKAQ